MPIVVWVVLGAVLGLVVSRAIDRGRETPGLDVTVGIVGAIFGGVVAHFLETVGASGLARVGSWALAMAGAALVLAVHHLIARRSSR